MLSAVAHSVLTAYLDNPLTFNTRWFPVRRSSNPSFVFNLQTGLTPVEKNPSVDPFHLLPLTTATKGSRCKSLTLLGPSSVITHVSAVTQGLVDSILPTFGVGLCLLISSMNTTPGSPLAHADLAMRFQTSFAFKRLTFSLFLGLTS